MKYRFKLLCCLGLLNVAFHCSLAFYTSSCVTSDGGGAGGAGGAGSIVPLQILCIVSSDDGQEVLPAISLAIEQVNQASCHNLNITVEYSECSSKEVLDIFHSHLFNPVPEVAVIGAGCSLSSEAVAEVSQYYNLSMVSYDSASMSLDDRDRFPYFFRTVPSFSFVSIAMTEVIFHYQWKRVLLITQDNEEFRLLSQDIAKRLEERTEGNITVVADVLLPKDLSRIPGTKLFPPGVRIVILNMNSDIARHVICEARSVLNWSEHSYVWLTQGWYEEQWWNSSSDSDSTSQANCTSEELLQFLQEQRALGIDHYPMAVNTNRSGINFQGNENLTRKALFAYDAVWALSEALDAVKSDVHSFDPFNVSHENRLIGEEIRDSIRNVTYTGPTGELDIKDGSRAVNEIRVLQYRASFEVVAVVRLNESDPSGGCLNVLQDVWPNNVTPSDGSPYNTRQGFYLWLVISSNILAFITIVAALACIIFNFIFRNRKLVRLSSPNLNYVIALGVIVFSSTVFFFSYPPVFDDKTINIYCGIRSWFAAIGYSLCFGTINTKMWRVYYIFHNPKPSTKKKPLKDIHLLLFVLIFILVDVVILTIATSITGVRLEMEILSDREHSSQLDDNGIIVHPQVSSCESKWKSLWLGVLFGYKIIIQAIGVFLAFKIRKVKIKVLNDSKEVVATLYISSVILIIVIIITLFFDDYQNVYAGGYSYGLPLSGITVLAVVFFSKMVRLYRDPDGNSLFTHITRDATGASGIFTTLDGNQVKALQKKIKQLEIKLIKYEENGIESSGAVLDNTDLTGQTTGTIPRESNCKHVRIILNNTNESSDN